MRKSELIEAISRDTGIIQSDVDLVLQQALVTVRRRLIEGKEVRLKEFGVFKTRQRPKKIARNLKGKENGKRKNPEPLVLPACTIPHFKPSKQFLKAA
jgi:nucleoid DNA-binding protein